MSDNTTSNGRPACAFGTPWDEHEPDVAPLLACPACREECERLEAEFEAGVKAGKWDARGYTPAERRAAQRRKAS